MVVMTLSMMQVSSGVFLRGRRLLRGTLIALVASYAGAGLVFIVLSRFLGFPPELWAGFVLVAIVPPAIAVIPFADILGGDTHVAVLGVLGSYIVSLALVPLLSFILLKGILVHPVRILVTLLVLVVVPLILSRVLRKVPFAGRINRWRGSITNWCFFLVTLTAIGLNRDSMVGNPLTLLRVFAVAGAGTFGVGILLQYVLAYLGTEKRFGYVLLLLATLKNGGLAIAVALSSFGKSASYPAAIVIICSILYFLWLGCMGKGGEYEGQLQQSLPSTRQ
jgi:BASS family bile acid:Na+ symporter